MSRSINTTMMILVVLVCLLLFGGATMRNMVLALLVGITTGAYSTICVATPLWYDIKRLGGKNRPKSALPAKA
jgi:preprotein translocase subunit SecF